MSGREKPWALSHFGSCPGETVSEKSGRSLWLKHRPFSGSSPPTLDTHCRCCRPGRPAALASSFCSRRCLYGSWSPTPVTPWKSCVTSCCLKAKRCRKWRSTYRRMPRKAPSPSRYPLLRVLPLAPPSSRLGQGSWTRLFIPSPGSK